MAHILPSMPDDHFVRQCEKIVQLRDAILAGTHRRIKNPYPSSIRSTPAEASPNLAAPTSSSGVATAPNDNSTSTTGRSNPPSSKSQSAVAAKPPINPIFLQKSSELIRAEIQLERQRIERAILLRGEEYRRTAATVPELPLLDIGALLREVEKQDGADETPTSNSPVNTPGNLTGNTIERTEVAAENASTAKLPEREATPSSEEDSLYSSRHVTPDPADLVTPESLKQQPVDTTGRAASEEYEPEDELLTASDPETAAVSSHLSHPREIEIEDATYHPSEPHHHPSEPYHPSGIYHPSEPYHPSRAYQPSEPHPPGPYQAPYSGSGPNSYARHAYPPPPHLPAHLLPPLPSRRSVSLQGPPSGYSAPPNIGSRASSTAAPPPYYADDRRSVRPPPPPYVHEIVRPVSLVAPQPEHQVSSFLRRFPQAYEPDASIGYASPYPPEAYHTTAPSLPPLQTSGQYYAAEGQDTAPGPRYRHGHDPQGAVAGPVPASGPNVSQGLPPNAQNAPVLRRRRSVSPRENPPLSDGQRPETQPATQPRKRRRRDRVGGAIARQGALDPEVKDEPVSPPTDITAPPLRQAGGPSRPGYPGPEHGGGQPIPVEGNPASGHRHPQQPIMYGEYDAVDETRYGRYAAPPALPSSSYNYLPSFEPEIPALPSHSPYAQAPPPPPPQPPNLDYVEDTVYGARQGSPASYQAHPTYAAPYIPPPSPPSPSSPPRRSEVWPRKVSVNRRRRVVTSQPEESNPGETSERVGYGEARDDPYHYSQPPPPPHQDRPQNYPQNHAQNHAQNHPERHPDHHPGHHTYESRDRDHSRPAYEGAPRDRMEAAPLSSYPSQSSTRGVRAVSSRYTDFGEMESLSVQRSSRPRSVVPASGYADPSVGPSGRSSVVYRASYPHLREQSAYPSQAPAYASSAYPPHAYGPPHAHAHAHAPVQPPSLAHREYRDTGYGEVDRDVYDPTAPISVNGDPYHGRAYYPPDPNYPGFHPGPGHGDGRASTLRRAVSYADFRPVGLGHEREPTSPYGPPPPPSAAAVASSSTASGYPPGPGVEGQAYYGRGGGEPPRPMAYGGALYAGDASGYAREHHHPGSEYGRSRSRPPSTRPYGTYEMYM